MGYIAWLSFLLAAIKTFKILLRHAYVPPNSFDSDTGPYFIVCKIGFRTNHMNKIGAISTLGDFTLSDSTQLSSGLSPIKLGHFYGSLSTNQSWSRWVIYVMKMIFYMFLVFILNSFMTVCWLLSGYKHMGCSKQYRLPLIVIYSACRRYSPCKDRSSWEILFSLFFLFQLYYFDCSPSPHLSHPCSFILASNLILVVSY